MFDQSQPTHTPPPERTSGALSVPPAAPVPVAPPPPSAVPPTPAARPVTSAAYHPPRVGFSKTLWVLVGVAAVLLLGAGGVWAYRTWYAPSSKAVFSKLLEQWSVVSSVAYEASIAMVPPADSGEEDISVSFDGVFDMTDSESPASAGTLAIPLGLPGTADLTIETVSVDDVFYLRVNNIPDLGFADLTDLNGQWVRISASDIAELGTQFGALEESANALEDFKQTQTDLENELRQKEDQLKALFVNSSALTLEGRAVTETIAGVETDHYQFVINPEKAKQLITDVLALLETELPDEQGLVATLNEAIDQGSLPAVGIWVGKQDSLPYRIALAGTVSNPDTPEESSSFAITVDFKNYNQPVAISAPATSLPLEEAIAPIVSLLSPEQELPADLPDTDADGLPDDVEALYGADPANPDTDADGYSDGTEVENGYNPNGQGELAIPGLSQ